MVEKYNKTRATIYKDMKILEELRIVKTYRFEGHRLTYYVSDDILNVTYQENI